MTLKIRSDRAFTLVELLVVITIIVIIIALAAPVIGNAQRAGKRARSIANAKNIAQGIYMYALDDRRREVPTAPTMEVGGAKGGGNLELDGSRPLASVLNDPKVFWAPGDKGGPGGSGVPGATDSYFQQYGTSYAYPDGNVGGIKAVSGESITTISNSSLKVVIFEPTLAWNDKDFTWYGSVGGVMGFLDGHAQMYELDNTDNSPNPDNGYY